MAWAQDHATSVIDVMSINPAKNHMKQDLQWEASGIDVFKTARNNRFKIEVLKSPDCKGNYFGLVLIL